MARRGWRTWLEWLNPSSAGIHRKALASAWRRRPGRSGSRPAVPRLEALEDRTLPTVHIQFDFSKDVNGFFTDPTRRQILQTAADNLTANMTNTLSAIVPGGGNTWQISFFDPATGATDAVDNPTIAQNTLLVYAGGQDLPASSAELGEGGFGGYSDGGSTAFLNTIATRGQSAAAFSPWGGAVTFTDNPTGGWYFGADPAQINNQNDFYTVATHELAHLLGIGTSPQWFHQVSGGAFTGPNAEAAFGNQPVPLDQSEPQDLNAHWAQSDLSNGQQPVMTPVLLQGTRRVFTPLDFAGLEDVGWQFPAAGSAPSVTSIRPAAGALTGNTTVTITGANLANATAVNFGANPATIVSDAATQIVVTSPPGAAGTVDVTVQTAGGVSTTGPADRFTYVGPVSLSQSTVSITSGRIAGGGTAVVTLTARDANGNQEPGGGLSVAFSLGAGGGVGALGSVTDNGNGTYTATFSAAAAGSAAITATINNQAVASTAAVTVTAGPGGVITTQTPVFTWLAVAGAVDYDIYVVDQTTGQSPVLQVASTPGTSCSLSSAQTLTPGHRFIWYLGAASSTGAITWSGPYSFTIAALAAPTPTGPVGVIAAGPSYDTPTFDWNNVAGAGRYYLYVLDVTTNQAVVNNSGVGGVSFTPTTALTPGHSFTWDVAAESINGAAFSWSGPQSFTLAALAAPTPTGPVGVIAAGPGYDTPTFGWNNVAGAGRYYLYVLDVTTNQAVVNNPGVSGVSFTATTALTPGHSFTWDVAAESINGAAFSWSGPQSFTLAALAQPAQNGPSGTLAAAGSTTTVTFGWNSTAGANHYYLYVLDAATGQAAVNNSSVSGTSFAIALKSGDNYTWYLAAESTSGAASWSGAKSFSLAAAALAQPMQNGPSGTIAASLHFDTPTFSWSAVSGAAQYYLYVLDATTNQPAVNNPLVSGTSYSNATLTPGHSYTWYIGAVSTNGVTGPIAWSGETFALAALTPPTPVGPSGSVSAQTVTATPTLNWNSVAGAAHYYVYLLDATTGQALVNNPSVSGTSYLNTPTLTVGHRYIWYVAAESTNGADLSWSGPTAFTLTS